jgi:hypothetical protein
MSAPGFDTSRCPLCGERNECGMAAGRDECWCTTVVIEKATLDRLPEAARGVVCVCARCVAEGQPGSDQGTVRRPLRVAAGDANT